MKRCFIFTVILLMMISSFVHAQMHMGGMRGGGGHGRGGGEGRGKQDQPRTPSANTDYLREILFFKNELNLSEKQEESVRGIREELIKETKKMYEAAEKPQQELSEMLSQNRPDFSGAKVKIKEITEILGDIQTTSIGAYEKAYNLLSDEQKQKLIAARKALEEKIRPEEHVSQNPEENSKENAPVPQAPHAPSRQ